MEPKEKARELIDKFEEFADDTECNVFTQSENRLKNAKECAIIAVNEILSINNERWYQLTGSKETYYKEVKQEIENYGK